MKCMVVPFVANSAAFYALPKIHSSILAFRLIVSNVGAASNNLTRFL